MSDGGEGFLEAMSATPYRTSLDSTVFPGSTSLQRQVCRVSGPLGEPVVAPMLLGDIGHHRAAVVESAQAAGLFLVGGPLGNDPLRASTRGVGQLIYYAIEAGAEEVVVGVGGTASTDGGLGAVLALSCGRPMAKLKRDVKLTVAADVEISFVEAAEKFAAQKGASSHQMKVLQERLERLAKLYRRRFGIEVNDIPGSGAGGGLAGGLAAIGADITSGFETVARRVGFHGALSQVDLVVTGEGSLDERSFDGKLVGKVIEQAIALGKAVLVVAGDVRLDARQFPRLLSGRVKLVSLVQQFGREHAMQDTVYCIEQAIREQLT